MLSDEWVSRKAQDMLEATPPCIRLQSRRYKKQLRHLQRKVLQQKKAAEVEGAEAADMGKARKKETHTAKTQRSSLLAQIGER